MAAELAARQLLGTPPLYAPHPRLEYQLKAGQDVRRFGRRIATDDLGLRSEPLEVPRPATRPRIVVMGDSVVNGGSLVDHDELATTLLARWLPRASGTGQRVEVANVSAGSWGPGNWRAFAEDPGFLGADAVVLVVSSHDATDNPTFAPLDPRTHPTRAPVSAIADVITRYLPRALPDTGAATGPDPLEPLDEVAVAVGLRDLEMLLRLAQARVPRVLVMQHLDRRELPPSQPGPGHGRIRTLCDALGVEVHSLGPRLAAALRAGTDPYRDSIHLNPAGQVLLAQAIEAALSSPPPVHTMRRAEP